MENNRFSRLDQLMASSNLDAIVLNPSPTLVYLTGLHFHLMERPTVLIYKPGDQPILIIPELEAGKLGEISIPLTVFTFGDDPAEWQKVFDLAFEKFLSTHLLIGVEPTRLRFLEMEYLQKAAPNLEFIPAEEIIGGLRLQKDQNEIACMREAVRIAQQALTATLPLLRPGTSEQEIASELIIQLYKAGSSAELPFAPIVASGPNSANPHAVPTSRKLKRGDLVVIDWGAGYDDLFSDLTRTFGIGELAPELTAIYAAVKSANAAGRAAGKPGLKAGQVDSAARSAIEHAGFGKFFTHRTGHGLGMEAHEGPYIFGGNPLLLKEDMVYTVEPGIYLPGKGGVRIEDNMVVTASGSESLSDFPRELQIL
jgi:Xaa-Pro dipeptidase